ncbi:MAG: hypothetical protein A2Y38_16150 [Spirochaetes bacterium GWB1_59_5]|nr:MAG: hypothetical protein A2Y38_16150 [Spirochaetes bacterium GWB1_59_5]
MAGAILTTIIDKFNEFSDSQAFTTGANTSTKSFDTKGADIGTGEDLYLTIQTDVTCTSNGNSTVAFAYVESDNADLSAADTLYTTAAIAYATLVAGYQVVKMKIPANTKRYVGVIYTVATADLTAGKFSAFLSKDLQSAKTRTFPSGYVNH